MSNELFRRQFLKTGVGFIAGAGSTILFGDFSSVLAQSIENTPFCPPSGCPPLPVRNEQGDWRYCNKCQAMFYQGEQGSQYDQRRGVCAAGGSHEPAGYYFSLPHDIPETSTAQTNWRYCNKCQAMFYLGAQGSEYERRRGACAAGGVHEEAGYIFVLPHDIPETSTTQTNWRYCNKCQAMFYLGAQGSEYERRRGACAAGGVHEEAGYIFVLSWYRPSILR